MTRIRRDGYEPKSTVKTLTIGSWTGTDGNRIGSIVAYQTGLHSVRYWP